MRRAVLLASLFCLLLSACARAATSSTWLTGNPSETGSSPTVLPATLAPTLNAMPKVNASSTPAPIGTLDIQALPAQLPESMKGYDLYSWQTGADWNFTLITGTNRNKTLDEITVPENTLSGDGFVKISVNGLNDLKRILSLLPKGTMITWGGIDLGGEVPAGMVYLTFPPQALMDEVTAYCKSLQLTLTSLKAQ
jgi:hypothetical protein